MSDFGGYYTKQAGGLGPNPQYVKLDCATIEIIGKAEAAMNLAASFLDRGDPTAEYHARNLMIAAGALARLAHLALSTPAPKAATQEKP